MIKKIIEFIISLFGLDNDNEEINKVVTEYEIKPLMTSYEKKMYDIIKKIGDEYVVIPQVNLASIIKKKNNNRYYSELFRNIDFAIFDKDMNKVLLLIEINDKTHNKVSRKDRDLKVKKICNDVGINIINFYSNYPNEESYVVNRILNEVKKSNY